MTPFYQGPQEWRRSIGAPGSKLILIMFWSMRVSTESKIEHLKFIQAVIARMGTNSFLLKGWTVTLVAALFAFGAKEADRAFVMIAWVPVLAFAGLDAYFLQRERLYRQLHDRVAARTETEPTDFSMDTAAFQARATLRSAIISQTVLGFTCRSPACWPC